MTITAAQMQAMKDQDNWPDMLGIQVNDAHLPSADEVRHMLVSIAGYFKHTCAMNCPSDLAEKLPMTLEQVCKKYLD